MTPFDTPDALALNQARMEHLESLGLPFQGKSVLEVGCGVGHFTKWLLETMKVSPPVVCVDGRAENIAELRRRMPDSTDGLVIDLDQAFLPVSCFHIVFCYGFIYHLENPLRVIRELAGAGELLLIESIITGETGRTLTLMNEPSHVSNQGLTPLAHWPSRDWIEDVLHALGFHVYRTPAPEHPDFTGGSSIQRVVLIGSCEPLDNSKLTEVRW